MSRKTRRSFGCRLGAAIAGAAVLGTGAIAWAAPPANDAFASAQTLPGATPSLTGTTVDATVESGEPGAQNGPIATVWYAWTAPASGKYRIRFAPAAGANERFYPELRVFTGSSVGALTQVDLYSPLDAVGYSEFEPQAVHAVAGTKYLFRVQSNYDYVFDPPSGQYQKVSVTGPFTLAIEAIPAPVNDDFDDALVLTGDTFATGAVTEAATLESGEPRHDANVGNGHSVWYRWTAPRTTPVLVSAFGLPAAAYTGTALNALTLVGRTDVYGDDEYYQGLKFDAVAGTTYSIAVDDGGDDYYGETAFNLRSFVRPENDDRANATVVSGTYLSITGNSLLSTHEPGEPANFMNPTVTDGESDTAGSVWYAWTAPVSGRADVTFADGRYAAFAVFTQAGGGALTKVDQTLPNPADPYGDDGLPELRLVDVTAGTRYLIAVDGGGTNGFAMRLAVSGGNDLFDHAADLAGAVVSTSGSNVGYANELGEPQHAGGGFASAWWNWTAPSTGDFLVSTAGSNFDTMLAVYTGDAVRALDRVAENDDAGAMTTSRLVLHAKSGTVYHVAVAGRAGIRYDEDYGAYPDPSKAASGEIHLSIRPGSATLSPNLSADPPLAKIDEGVEFSAGASGGSEFRWDFGDGATATTSSARTTHSYDSAATFHVVVTAVDGSNEATSTLDVVVSQDLAFVVTAFNAALNFRKQNADSVTVTGTLGMPQGVSAANQTVTVDVGGIFRTFTLNAAGAGTSGTDSLKITQKAKQNAKIVLRFAKASLQSDLADEGLDNADSTGDPVLVPVTVTIGNTVFDTNVQAYWTARAGKSGVAK